jgi:FtsH-binding integral membrane protein
MEADKKKATVMDRAFEFLVLTMLVAVAICAFVALCVAATRWARRGSPGAAFAGWALLLLGSGMNPQPPPQEQVEQANRERKIRKDAESGAPK